MGNFKNVITECQPGVIPPDKNKTNLKRQMRAMFIPLYYGNHHLA